MEFGGIVERYERSCTAFEHVLREVRADQWAEPTPCTEWTVRLLVNHMTQGNRNYVFLLDGGAGAEMLRRRGQDVLGDDPVAAFTRAATECAAAFRRPGVLDRVVDYPLGRVSAAQALAVRTADSVVHTWDLARAIGADETLDAEMVEWLDENMAAVYQGLVEVPTAAETTHRYFAKPADVDADASRQTRLLVRFGRTP